MTVALELEDILVMARPNVQLADMRKRPGSRARVGTSDKLQGQVASVVIYSLATSLREEALIPRRGSST
jgi:hypothetical protein